MKRDKKANHINQPEQTMAVYKIRRSTTYDRIDRRDNY